MAKATAVPEPTYEFETYVPEKKPGHYDAQVKAMIERDEKIKAERPEDYEKGERTVIKVAFPTDDVEKYKRFFQDSAKNFDKTARIVGKPEPQGDGGTLFRFKLAPKTVRKATTETAPEATTDQAATPEAANAA